MSGFIVTVVPGQRIPVLESFYATGVMTDKVTTERFMVKNASDDHKGRWTLDRANAAAKELGVFNFVTALDDGGSLLPVIQPADEYIEAYCQPVKDRMALDQEDFELREAMVRQLRAYYMAVQATLEKDDRKPYAEAVSGEPGGSKARQKKASPERKPSDAL